MILVAVRGKAGEVVGPGERPLGAFVQRDLVGAAGVRRQLLDTLDVPLTTKLATEPQH